MSMKFTPGPWTTGGVMTRVEMTPPGWNMPMCIADCHAKHAPESEAERVANARLIVRAVNCHDELLAELQNSTAALMDWQKESGGAGILPKVDYQIRANQAAIAKAAGE